MDNEGTIYLLIEKEYFDNKKNIYKLGKIEKMISEPDDKEFKKDSKIYCYYMTEDYEKIGKK